MSNPEHSGFLLNNLAEANTSPTAKISPSWAPTTLILAIGNPLRGDDGVGTCVLEMLTSTNSLPSNVTVSDGGVQDLMTALVDHSCQRVLIVDAAEMGRLPGEWARFTLDEARLASNNLTSRWTLHSVELAEALALGKALERLPPEIVIFGVQPKQLNWTTRLSDPVQRAVPEICQSILEELDI